MVLIITITLSNGGKVVYEIDNNFYSKRDVFLDKEGNFNDFLVLYKFGNAEYHEFFIQNTKMKVQSLKITEHPFWTMEVNFLETLTSFELGDYVGLQFIKSLPSPNTKIEIAHFYIEIPEIYDLHLSESDLELLPLIKDEYILAFSDVRSNSGHFIKPTNVSVQWKSSFSKFFLNSLEKLNSN